MPILYEGQTGMPWEVPASDVENYIRKGYRTSPPPVFAQTLPLTSVAASAPTPATPPPASLAPNVVRINIASLKDLTTLPGVGTALAKQVRDGRPYGSIEDLIAKFPEEKIDWLTLVPRLSFEQATEQTTTEPDNAAE